MGLGAVSCLYVGAHEGTRRFDLYTHGGRNEAEVFAIGSTLSGNQRPIPYVKVRIKLANGRSVEHQLSVGGRPVVGARLTAYCNADGSDCELDPPRGGRWGTVFGATGFGMFLAAIAWSLARHSSPDVK